MKRLSKIVKSCLEKSKDSAILAIETYNKPAVKFKSGGFVVMMVIAYTALFHAIFFKRKIRPYYKEDNGYFYKKVDGDYKFWELNTCLKEYFKTDTQNPIRKNLDFFVKLRNKIEHRSFPEIDSNIFGECQSMLLNYDDLIESEFGSSWCLREALSFSLQLFRSPVNLGEAVKANKDLGSVVDFIESYRSSISTDVVDSGKYSFKAFLVQVANHPSASATPIQFIRYDSLDDKEKAKINKLAALVKYKYKEVSVSNANLIKPSAVQRRVQLGLGDPKVLRNGNMRDKFTMDAHTRSWKKYNVRPLGNADQPEKTNQDYCIYDQPHDDYLYTDAWVEFLIKDLSDEAKFNSLYE